MSWNRKRDIEMCKITKLTQESKTKPRRTQLKSYNELAWKYRVENKKYFFYVSTSVFGATAWGLVIHNYYLSLKLLHVQISLFSYKRLSQFLNGCVFYDYGWMSERSKQQIGFIVENVSSLRKFYVPCHDLEDCNKISI